MKTPNGIPKGLQKDLIETTRGLLQAQTQWDTNFHIRPGEPYMTMKQFQTLLGYCNRDTARRTLNEYIRYPIITKEHPLFPLFQIENQPWYAMVTGIRGGTTGHTYGVPMNDLRSHVQDLVIHRSLAQPYEPPAELAIKHFALQTRPRHHNHQQLLRETLRKQFPQFSRQTIWRAMKSFSHSHLPEGGRP